ncbi:MULTISPECIES: ABC transporter permease [unclassified Natrinema]|uniref:ABC transporter permease n=1 Tax=unclassified Natrinema TaxID=2622230 RepID=UPI0011AEC20C
MVMKQLLLLVRYRVNFIIQTVSMYLFFAVIFFGGKAVARNIGGGAVGALSSTFDGLIVGWFLWTMAQSAYSGLQGEITSESMRGTLEHLYLSPYGFGSVMCLKIIVNVLLSFFWGAVMLVSMMVTTQIWLTVDLLTILPIIIFSLMSVIGIGFGIAGLALIYKKVGSISNLMQFGLVGLIAAPVTGISLLRFLPLAQGSAMLQMAMQEGVALWDYSLRNIALLVGTGIFYFVLGYLLFIYCATIARKRGVMGHY